MEPPPPTRKGEHDTDLALATMSNLFERPGSSSTLSLPETAVYPIPGPSASNIHNRSISLESAQSLAQGSQALSTMSSRNHPSLQGYNGVRYSPDTIQDNSAASRRDRYSGVTPSSSRKRVNQAYSDDEDGSEELEPLDPDATEEERKVHKRRQNTLAARRSRAKKAMETITLKEENSKLKTENAIWKERALMMERLLANHGLPCPNFR